MKIKYLYSLIILGMTLVFPGCTSLLDEDVYSQLDPGTLFNSANGVERVLFSAYRDAQFNGNFGGNIEFQEEWTADQFWETGGAVNLQATVMLAFTWDADYPTQNTELWNKCYASIRNCNLVLENIDSAPLDATVKARLSAEARFIRGAAYYKLFMRYAGVPLRLTTTGDLEMARSSADEIGSFIESEWLATIDALPKQISEISGYQYGRATKGAAMGFLCKYYLNTRQWQKCADMAKQIMDLGIYELWADYTTLFNVENEQRNKEFIWVYTCSPLDVGNELMNGSFPQQFASTVDGSIVFLDNMRNWARMDRLYDSFYNSFDEKDDRRKTILTEYINTAGKTISLLNNDNTRMFKYTPDVNANGNPHGNDIPVIRYADILLARAEALNELNGPTQESVDLINQVRTRSNVDPIQTGDYNKESLRAHILDERGWEFYGENLRRQDLLRHDVFIKKAKERGVAIADDHHKLFPIPQTEINANPLCEQNLGYY